MCKKILFVFSIFTFILFTKHVYATRITREEAVCPVCDAKFTGQVVMSSNNFGGIDHDLCPHAMGSSPLSSYMWGCPECNFCGYSGTFKETFSPEEKNKLLNWLKSNYPKKNNNNVRQVFDVLPSHKRYEIAAEIAKTNKDTNYNIARLYLRAAWSARHQGMADPDSEETLNFEISREEGSFFEEEFEKAATNAVSLANRARALGDIILRVAGKLRFEKIPNDVALPTYFLLALQLRGMGENVMAEDFLQMAEKIDDSEKLAKYIAAMRHSIKIESELQKKTIKYLLASVDEKEEKNEAKLIESTILLAELNRRVGNFDDAEKYYIKLFEFESTPELFIETVKYGLKYMNREDAFPIEKAKEFEKKKIEASLSMILDPIEGREAAQFLHFSKNRELIFPKLIELIEKNIDDVSELAFMAMSDETQEAVDFQLKYLKQGKYERIILGNLIRVVHLIPSETLLELFEKDDYKIRMVDFLRTKGDKACVEALVKKAEKELTSEVIGRMGEDKKRDYDEERYQKNLLMSLATTRDARALLQILNTIDIVLAGKENDYSTELFKTAGAALEVFFNRFFGFSYAFNRQREPKTLKVERFDSVCMNETYSKFKEWHSKNKDLSIEVLVMDGFKEMGYKTMPIDDVNTIKELVAGLSDSFMPIRINSFKELVRRTGITFKTEVGLDPSSFPRDFQEVVGLCNIWLEENFKKLEYDKSSEVFKIKN